jgi:uncharacterized membrane protein
MHLNSKLLLLINLLTLVFWNITFITNIDVFNTSTFLSIYFLFFLPGKLISSIIKINVVGKLESLSINLGLSVTYVLISGLFVNFFLPLLGVPRPLELLPLLVYFNVTIFAMLSYIYLNTKTNYTTYNINIKRIDPFSITSILIFSALPTLSFIGAQLQNNGMENILSQLFILLIVLITIAVVSYPKKFRDWQYQYLVLMIAFSLLLSFSLRSSHIIGYDVHEEYRVFQLTKDNGRWSMLLSPHNQYNACLSITILPTIISIFTKIQNEYIFKIFNQAIFAFTPLIIFFISRNRGLNNIKSYFTSFIFVAQLWFMLQMPELNRQEYALLFFSLLVYVLLNNELHTKLKKFLFIVFGISVILSHYSTAYLLVAMLLIYRLMFIIFSKRLSSIKPYVSKYLLVILMTLTYLWNFTITQTGDSFIKVSEATWNKRSQLLGSDIFTNGVDRLLFKSLNISTNENLYNNYQRASDYYANRLDNSLLYHRNIYSGYVPEIVESEIVPSKFSNVIADIIYYLMKINKFFIVYVFVFVGIFHSYIRNKNDIHEFNYLLLSVSTLPLLIGIIFLPELKLSYNIERVYMQALIVSASISISAIMAILNKIRYSKQIVVSMLILFLLQSTGLINQYIGGIPYLNLNNYGDGFNKYFTPDSEVNSAKWLKQNNNNGMIYADQMGSLRLRAYANMTDVRYELFPSTITIPSYLYLTKTNNSKDTSFFNYDIDFISYKITKDFYSSNKNLIYNNGNSTIFR